MKFDFSPSIFWLSLLAVISAELGCFVRTAAIAVRYGSPLSVCLGTLLGNLILLLPIFFVGDWLHRVLPPTPTRVVSGLLLMTIGLIIILSRD